MAKVTNEEIYKKLLCIERILRERLIRKSFTEITEWKKYIWDNCPHRKEKVSSNEIDFWCELMKDSCEFEKCPRNIVD